MCDIDFINIAHFYFYIYGPLILCVRERIRSCLNEKQKWTETCALGTCNSNIVK